MAYDIEPFRGGPGGNLYSRSSREAVKRSVQRKVRSFLIRLRRAGFTFAALFIALVAYMVVAGSVGPFTFLAALFAMFMAAMLVMSFPVSDRRARKEAAQATVDGRKAGRLDRLASHTQDWLLERCRALPSQAGPSLDRIVDRLRDLEPSLATVPADSPLGGEAQRLIGQHLPSLVDTYFGLPPGERTFYSETSSKLAESLGIVANQMDDLCERIAHERRIGFDTERRFLETRYTEDGRLSLDRPN